MTEKGDSTLHKQMGDVRKMEPAYPTYTSKVYESNVPRVWQEVGKETRQLKASENLPDYCALHCELNCACT